MAVSGRKTGKYTGLDSASIGGIFQGLDNGAAASVSVDNGGSQVVCSADNCSPLYRPMTRKIQAQVCVPLSHAMRESMNKGPRDFDSEITKYARREVAMAIVEQLVNGGFISFDQNIEFDGSYPGPRMVVRGELEIPS